MKRFSPILILYICLISSCGSSSVLVLTDPHWEFFNNQADRGYNFFKYWTFIKRGLVPHFETYEGNQNDFSPWFDHLYENTKYRAVITTVPYRDSLAENLPESVKTTVVMGKDYTDPDSDSCLVGSRFSDAFGRAGRVLKEKWQKENRIPLAVICRGTENFDSEYEALLSSWGDDRDVLIDNILIFDLSSADAEAKLNSFYNRFNFKEGQWTLLAAAEPFFSEILKTWPTEDNIEGILMSPDHKYLPDNIISLIVMDNREMLTVAASLVKDERKGASEAVEARFINR